MPFPSRTMLGSLITPFGFDKDGMKRAEEARQHKFEEGRDFTTIDEQALAGNVLGNAYNYYTGQSPYGDEETNYGEIGDAAVAVRDGAKTPKALMKTKARGMNITPFPDASKLSKVPRAGAALGGAIAIADGFQNAVNLYDAHDSTLGNTNPLAELYSQQMAPGRPQSRMAATGIQRFR